MVPNERPHMTILEINSNYMHIWSSILCPQKVVVLNMTSYKINGTYMHISGAVSEIQSFQKQVTSRSNF